MRRHRIAAALVKRISRVPVGRSMIRRVSKNSLYQALIGYHRPFGSLREACEAVAPFANLGHQNIANADLHLKLNETARPSDYAALFHIRPLLPKIHRIYDLGGNVGNLYYCYSRYLDLDTALLWQVQDLPEMLARGKALAEEREAHQLEFSGDWTNASGADLLIASGSLHYFETKLAKMVQSLRTPPTHILINRTPLTNGEPVATIQEARTFRVACMLYNRQDLIRDFETIGYRVVDTWQCPELSLEVPGYPEHSVPAYSGLFLTREDRRSGSADHAVTAHSMGSW